jgi:hypothetical protein
MVQRARTIEAEIQVEGPVIQKLLLCSDSTFQRERIELQSEGLGILKKLLSRDLTCHRNRSRDTQRIARFPEV